MKHPKLYLFLSFVVIGLIILGLAYTSDIPLQELKKKYCNSASQFISIENVDVHYRKEGYGNKILLLHGTASSLHTWDAYTQTLKDSFEVIRLDLPGFGLTGPFQNTDYSIQHYVEFIDEFTEALALDTFTLMGNSLGGQLALEYAVTFPHKTKSLVLIDPAGAPYENPSAFVFTLAKIPVVNLLLKWITPKSFIRKNLKEVYHDDSKVNSALVDRYYELTLRSGNRQAFIDRAKTPDHQFSQSDLDIETNTFIIWGKEDKWIPPEEAEFFLGLPNSKLLLIDDCGHVPMEECPDRTIPAILNFLDQ